MTPSAIHLRNYRSFPGPQTLELRPLTLYYGGNSAGKSALVRLLPLLADSVGPLAPVMQSLDLSSPSARGGTFRELRWKGLSDSEPPELLLELEWRGDRQLARASFELDEPRPWRRLLIKRFAFQDGEGRDLLVGEWLPRSEELKSAGLTYRLTSEGKEMEIPISFYGLVPHTPSGREEPVWALARERLSGLWNAVQWLGTRQVSERIFALPTAPRWRMQPDGSDVGELLDSQPEVLAAVSRWCKRYLQRGVEISEVPPSHFRIVLRHMDELALDVDLVDAGEGVLKVLPVLAAIALAGRRAPEAPRILAIEEPESHLHPTLQRALAEYIVDAVREYHQDGRCIILETHSQHILLGVQIQVARGRLRPDQVQVYWVHQERGRSRAEPVRLDEDGRLVGSWPSDVYTEIHDMAGELILARQERSRS
jgi:hypothetical protein